MESFFIIPLKEVPLKITNIQSFFVNTIKRGAFDKDNIIKFKGTSFIMFNTPGVAEAVLQSPPSLIH